MDKALIRPHLAAQEDKGRSGSSVLGQAFRGAQQPIGALGCLDVMTVMRADEHKGRRKTTVYLEAELLVAAKVLDAARSSSESQVMEDALRAYLRGGELAAAGAGLGVLMERVGQRTDLYDDEAMALALGKVRAVPYEKQTDS